MEVGKVSKEK